MKYGEMTLGRIEAIINKIGGEEGVRRLLAGELVVQEAIQKLIIKLGTGARTVEDFVQLFNDNNCRMHYDAGHIMELAAFKTATRIIPINLVIKSVADLHLKNGANYSTICRQAQKYDLELCSPEVGPQLRLQYTNQPIEECLNIAMRPIMNRPDELEIFKVEHSDCDISFKDSDKYALWLNTVRVNDDVLWSHHDRFVFVSH